MKFLMVFVIISFSIVIMLNSCQSKKKYNLKNIEKIEIGMDSSEALKIMGQPIEKRFFKGELFYDYEIPLGESGQCQIVFDSSGKVIFFTPRW